MTTRGAATALLPSFRTKDRQLFKTTRIDFAGPLTYKISKKEQGKINANNFHVRYVKSTPFRSNQVKKRGRVQGEAECLYYPMYQAKTHRVR